MMTAWTVGREEVDRHTATVSLRLSKNKRNGRTLQHCPVTDLLSKEKGLVRGDIEMSSGVATKIKNTE